MKQNVKLAESIRTLQYMNLMNFKDNLIEYFLDKESLAKIKGAIFQYINFF